MFEPISTENQISGLYDSGLVGLSYIIAVIASYTALDIAIRISESFGISRKFWASGCAFAMGCGIWSMHFTGMLAYQLPFKVTYNIWITLLSIIIAVLSSGFGLFIANRNRKSKSDIAVGGLVMGVGVASMHYTGMMAMEFNGSMDYQPYLFVLSILIAVIAATAALWLIIYITEKKSDFKIGLKFIAALVMGLAVFGMHYTGMEATHYTLDSGILSDYQITADARLFAFAISSSTLLIFCLAIIASITHKEFHLLKGAKDELEILVTERTKELERSNYALQEFASMASHDLQEPLRKIKHFGEELKDGANNLDEESEQNLSRIQQAAERMQTLISDLLKYSQVKTTSEPFKQIDLRKIVDEVIENLEERILDTQGSIIIENLPKLDAEAFQMRELFQNLIGNGLKYHREGVPPIIKIKSTEKENWEISIEDNGIGFDQQYVEKIFMPFQRLHGRSAFEGTGLGLSICQRIVEHHKGTINAQGLPGKGSKFSITLPKIFV